MATIEVSNAAQLTSALQAAKGGDVIRLASGDYGSFSISAKAFASDVTITSKDPGNPAVFDALSVKGSQNINFVGVNVDFTPDANTVAWSSAVMIDGSKGITFQDGVVTGGAAVNGVAVTAAALDATGNVKGLPAARGFTVQNSSDVSIEGTDISQFDRGVIIVNSGKITISDNEIHDLRRTPIVGGGEGGDILIEGNHMHSINPWRYGETPVGDHADFIALWTDAKQTVPTDNVTIRDNVMEQGHGAPVLGVWLQGGAATFTNVVIEDNAIMTGDHQGIMLFDVSGGSISDNVLLSTVSGKMPGIILQPGAKGIDVTGNVTAFVEDKSAGITGSTVRDNTIAQTTDALKTGFYDGGLVTRASSLVDAAAIQQAVVSNVSKAAPVVQAVMTSATTLIDAPTAGGKAIIGKYLAETLSGTAGGDSIAGGGGADVLSGGAGNDTYIVPNGLAKIVEKADAGVDTVVAKHDYALAANLENLTLTGTGSGFGTGNELKNIVIGNDGNNKLSGLDGADTLDGGAGNDTLLGGSGNDVLLGGAGNDVLTGGTGGDTFVLSRGFGSDRITDFSYAEGDRIRLVGTTKYTASQMGSDVVVKIEGGDQLVLSGVNMSSLKDGWIGSADTLRGTTVAANTTAASPIEPVVVTAAQTLVGSYLANNLVGGAGNDTLDGRGGTDTLTGGAGDDTYIVPNSLATIFEKVGGGIDTVVAKHDYTLAANLENLTLTDVGSGFGTGNELNNVIVGNAGNNKLSGLDGADTISGGLGNDTVLGGAGNDALAGGVGNDVMTGGSGADRFEFGHGSGVDRILDFSFAGGDRVHLADRGPYTVSQVGVDTVLDYGGGDQLVLVGVKMAALSAGWVFGG